MFSRLWKECTAFLTQGGCVDFLLCDCQTTSSNHLKEAEPFAAFLSRGLYQSMMTALEADEAYLAKNPMDKGYFGDGVSFVGNPEGFTSCSVKKEVLSDSVSAKVAVDFMYVDKRKPKEWSVKWTNVILLVREKRKYFSRPCMLY